MTPNDSPYSVLYYLSGSDITLIEIRRNDLGAENDPSKLYHWLWFNADGGLRERLSFVSMHSATPDEERVFAQGTLRFNALGGTFLEAGAQHPHLLSAVQHAMLAPMQAAGIAAYLAALAD